MISILLAACAGPRPGEVARTCKDHESVAVGGTALLGFAALILIAVLIWTVLITRLHRTAE